MKRFLEAGRLNSPRGIKGEVRFDCWCDSPDFLIGVNRFYLDDKGERFLTVKQYRPSIPSIVFEGYEDRAIASTLTGRTIYFDRNDITLEEGVCFNDDLISLPVYDVESGEQIGILERIDEGVSSDFYFVRGDKHNFYIPVRDEFVKEISLETGIRVRLIDGLEM
jgi:16S rRNA processing protein RimM